MLGNMKGRPPPVFSLKVINLQLRGPRGEEFSL